MGHMEIIYKIKQKIISAAALTLTLCLTACGRQTNNGCSDARDNKTAFGKTVLVLAAFGEDAYLRKQMEQFNEINEAYQIEVKKYERSDQTEEDGILLLQREIATGKGPDIIDFGTHYTTSDIVGAYTEDLFPYMAEEKQAYFENILQAFSYQEKLYALPMGFTLKSFAGARQNLGELNSWSIQEMMECYESQREKRILYPGVFKKDIFGTVLTGSMDYYIDWETGECCFEGTEFRDMLQFCNSFPDHLEITDDFSPKKLFLEDKALLLPVNICTIFDICKVEHIFGEEEVGFIGFPVEGESGTMIEAGAPVLAINSASAHKDGAWEFLSQCLSSAGQSELLSGFPIRRSALEEQMEQALETAYEVNEEGERVPVIKQQVLFEGEEPAAIYCITPRQSEQLYALIEQARICSQVEPKIYAIFLEEADYYFHGDKSLEETVGVIQSKVSIYVNEKIS